jgi:hypothetical protein
MRWLFGSVYAFPLARLTTHADYKRKQERIGARVRLRDASGGNRYLAQSGVERCRL